jgi:hypothetical protein
MVLACCHDNGLRPGLMAVPRLCQPSLAGWQEDESVVGRTMVLAHWHNNKLMAGRMMVPQHC